MHRVSYINIMACNCKTIKNILNTAANGAIGLGRVALRLGIATTNVIKNRRDKCRLCENSTKNPKMGLTNFSYCKICKCNIMAKSQLLNEKCPNAFWEQ